MLDTDIIIIHRSSLMTSLCSVSASDYSSVMSVFFDETRWLERCGQKRNALKGHVRYFTLKALF